MSKKYFRVSIFVKIFTQNTFYELNGRFEEVFILAQFVKYE